MIYGGGPYCTPCLAAHVSASVGDKEINIAVNKYMYSRRHAHSLNPSNQTVKGQSPRRFLCFEFSKTFRRFSAVQS